MTWMKCLMTVLSRYVIFIVRSQYIWALWRLETPHTISVPVITIKMEIVHQSFNTNFLGVDGV